MSRALSRADGVASLSEPDVFTQLVALRAFDHSNDATIGALLADCTKIMAAACRSRGATATAFKFRSYVIEVSDLLYRAFPEARVVFLYRDAETWARSVYRALGIGAADAAPPDQQIHRTLIPLVAAYATTHATPISAPELLACLWVSTMERCLELQRQDVTMFCARFDDLQAAPREVIEALLAYCGCVVADRAKLDEVLARDSQAGTLIAQTKARQSARDLTDHDIDELKRLIRHYSPGLEPSMFVEQTYRPLQ